jgi:NAD(P)-dependent dehydrogenase (short-subunit alcohol dehydrogenase family)
MDATALLRPGLLDGRVVALGGGSGLAPPLAALGAATPALLPTLDEGEAAEHARVALATHGALDVLLHDLRPAFGAGGGDGLRAALDLAWVTARAVATTAFIPGERGGRIALLAPRPGGSHPDAAAEAVRAATENLARTLSIEWSRYGIRTVAIAPGAGTSDAELAALAAYLASPAGDYFSGCRLALGDVA